jgi:hypothetical protein
LIEDLIWLGLKDNLKADLGELRAVRERGIELEIIDLGSWQAFDELGPFVRIKSEDRFMSSRLRARAL